jgi:flagellar operon protein
VSQGAFIYPQVSTLPTAVDSPTTSYRAKKLGVPGPDFDQIIDEKLKISDLTQIRAPVKFSAHANQRVQDRKILLDPALLAKIGDAVDQAASKGVEDTLVLTADAAFIINVPHRTVVTALDRKGMAGNVFTNIDGAIVV